MIVLPKIELYLCQKLLQKMNKIDLLRDSIIDRLLAISNKDYLSALYQLVDKSVVESECIELSEEYTLLLQLSETDIANGNVISQSEIDKSDLKWLKEQ
jgi:hypothetical protein